MKNLYHRGFTLVEIMIVITIIATLAALAIPIFITARMNANEASAITSCNIIYTACQSYYTNVMPHTFPSALDDLGTPTSNPPYLSSNLAINKQKQGYGFVYNFVDSESFTLNADPITPGTTGKRYFYVDESGVIRAKTGGAAGPSDPPIE